MRPQLVLAPGIALVATLAAALAFAGPPGDRPGPGPGKPNAEGKPPGKPGDQPGGRDHGDHGGPGGPGKARPFGSALPAPSGSALGHFAHGRGPDAGAPRDRGERAREHKKHLRMRFRHMFHGQAPSGLGEEMRRHARRVARIQRAREVAEQAKDADAVARADKLLEKENQRHERWIGKHATPPGVASAAAGAAAPTGSAP
ncbi:MAG: hypothetical protein ACOY0T_31785 [Myxococcota bacterium]